MLSRFVTHLCVLSSMTLILNCNSSDKSDGSTGSGSGGTSDDPKKDDPGQYEVVLGSTFVDLPAAPNGAPVTVYGTNVNGPIIVGDKTLSECPIVNETVYEIATTGRRLAKTTCWLADLPEGETTIKAGESDTMPFRVNSGTVTILTTFAQLSDAIIDNPSEGSIFLLRGFTTDLAKDGKIDRGKSTIWMREDDSDGTVEMPIALIGYPGDPAKFVTSKVDSNSTKSIQLDNNGWIVANLDFDNIWLSMSARGNARFVGNRLDSMKGKKYGLGTGSAVLGGQSIGGYFLGNTIVGGASNNRFDHAIYLTDCPDQRGWTVGWNYIHDNDFARGPQLVINHQTQRCGPESDNKLLASHYVDYNTIDTTSYRGRCIGINSLGWYPSNPNKPSASYLRNNDLINCGYIGDENDIFGDPRNGAALSVSRGLVEITGNRFYGAQDGISLGNGDDSEFIGAIVESNQIGLELGEGISIAKGIEDKIEMNDNTIEPPQQ